MMIVFFLILFIAQKSQKYKIITLRLFSKTNKTLCKFYMMRDDLPRIEYSVKEKTSIHLPRFRMK